MCLFEKTIDQCLCFVPVRFCAKEWNHENCT